MENQRRKAGANGARAIRRARGLAVDESARVVLTWDMDTGWAGDAYDFRWDMDTGWAGDAYDFRQSKPKKQLVTA